MWSCYVPTGYLSFFHFFHPKYVLAKGIKTRREHTLNMSAERRFEQRRFRLEESVTQNGGARTVFIEHMTPGTTVPPHYHTRQYKLFYPYISKILWLFFLPSRNDATKSGPLE